MTSEPSGTGQPVVLIHGLWLTPLSWEHWIPHFEARGHQVLAPSWPGLEGDVEAVRRNTSQYERLGVKEIVDHYDGIIRGLDEKPIIMGHSFGGLITQLLLDRGLGAAGVALSPAQIKGVLILPPAQAKVTWVVLKNPANRHRTVALDAKQFKYGFCNTLSDSESENARSRYAVPGPGRVLFQAAFANFNPHAVTKVDLHSTTRAPLLLVANGKDHTVPASVTRAQYKLQRKAKSVTEIKEYADRNHFTAGAPGWEEVADYALDWAVKHATVPAVA
jgi:alpha-beta hydrolase superfamily lysophospholipase